MESWCWNVLIVQCWLRDTFLQVIEVVHPAEGVAGGRAKLIIFVHGGAWGSGRTW